MATITYKCPNCDGGLLFDPSTQKYHCEYCQSSFSQEELDAPGSRGGIGYGCGRRGWRLRGRWAEKLAGGSAGAAPQTAEAFSGEAAVNRRRLRTVMRRMRLTRAMRCSTPAPAAARRS